MRRLMHRHIHIIIHRRGIGIPRRINRHLIEAEIDRSSDRPVELVEVTGYGDGEGGRTAEACGGCSADVEDEVGVRDSVGEVEFGDLGEFGVAAVGAAREFVFLHEDGSGYRDDGECGGPERGHSGEDLVFYEVYFVAGGDVTPLEFEGVGEECYAEGSVDYGFGGYVFG